MRAVKANELAKGDEVLFVVEAEVAAEIGDERETCAKTMWSSSRRRIKHVPAGYPHGIREVRYVGC